MGKGADRNTALRKVRLFIPSEIISKSVFIIIVISQASERKKRRPTSALLWDESLGGPQWIETCGGRVFWASGPMSAAPATKGDTFFFLPSNTQVTGTDGKLEHIILMQLSDILVI